MKRSRKMIAAATSATLMIAMLTGACGHKDAVQETEKETETQLITVIESEENTGEDEVVNMPNPMKEVTAEELAQAIGFDMQLPEGAQDISYFTIDDGTGQLMGSVSFLLDDRCFTYRAQKTDALEAYDMSGVYLDINDTKEVQIGHTDGTLVTDGEYYIVYWMDIVPGINYTLSCLDGVTEEKMLEVANLVFTPIQGDSDGVVISDAFAAGDYCDTSAEEHNSVTFAPQEDGTYAVTVSILKLSAFEGSAFEEDGVLKLNLIDPNGELMYAEFAKADDGTYTLTFTESSWNLLESGTVFTGFFIE